MEAAIVTDVLVQSNLPNVPEKYKILLPKTLISETCEFTLNGVSCAVSRGLARTLSCEMPIPAMVCEGSFTTSDRTIIPEMIAQRLRSIPIKTNIDPEAKFALKAKNNTASVMEVYTAAIKYTKTPDKPQPFNTNIVFLELQPGCDIYIPNIRISFNCAYEETCGMQTAAVNVASIALDVVPKSDLEAIDPKLDPQSTMTANPRQWKIMFTTNGQCPSRELVAAACDNLIGRLKKVADKIPQIENNGDKYVWIVQGETMTIGGLITKTVCDLHPDIPAIVPTIPCIGRSVTFKIASNTQVDSIIREAIDFCIAVYTKIRNEIKA